MADEESRVFGGRYEMHRKIARGGMADVYLARDSLLDRPVAVKVLFPEFATDEAFVERFRREAQAAANLSHPNIVSVYDWGEEDRTYFIVMEYVEGRSLAQIVKDEGALLPDRAADIVTDVAAALGAAHRNGVVHRDVKPGNVIISPLGQVKVADFGIARALSTQENLTQTGTVMGTATYFSPEQARGEPVDPRSDVYSLGVVLYELLVGAPPFTGDNPISVAYKHVQEPAALPSSRNPQVPPALDAVTMKALAKNPANRYASADDMAADLRRFRDGRPVVAESIMAEESLTRAMPSVREEATQAVARTGDATRAVPAVGGGGHWDDEPTRRSPAFIAVVGLIILALIVGLALVARSFTSTGAAQVAVPKVVDLDQQQATDTLRGAGFKVTPTSASDTSKADGIVLSQNPQADSKADKGSTVTITVNSAQPIAPVPDVVGKPSGDADSALRAAGFVADILPQIDASTPEGQVISQDPQAGQSLARGKHVKITVSRGPGTANVPDVTGLSSTDAANKLGRAGFNTSFANEPSDTVEQGKVTRTDPPAGTQLNKGDKVTVYVSSGSSTVPSVIDLSAGQATAKLQQAGFNVQQKTRTTLDPQQDGLVVDQSPQGGTPAKPGATVTIYVGRLVGSSTTSSSTTPTTKP